MTTLRDFEIGLSTLRQRPTDTGSAQPSGAPAVSARQLTPGGRQGSIFDWTLNADEIPKDAPKVEAPKSRTWTEAAADTGASVMSGFAGIAQAAGTLYGVITGNPDNALERAGDDAVKFWQNLKSDYLKGEERKRADEIEKADGLLAKAWVAAKLTAQNPALLSSFAAEQAPQFTVMGPAGKGAQLAAKAAGVGAKVAAGVGTSAAVGVGAAMQGADAADGVYTDLMGAKQKLWDANKDYQLLREKGASDQEARAAVALKETRIAFAKGAASTALLSLIPGSRSLERAISGIKGTGGRVLGAVKGGIGETVQNAADEGYSQYAQNQAKRSVDPSIDPMQGVGEQAGMGALFGPLGAATGAMNGESAEARGKLAPGQGGQGAGAPTTPPAPPTAPAAGTAAPPPAAPPAGPAAPPSGPGNRTYDRTDSQGRSYRVFRSGGVVDAGEWLDPVNPGRVYPSDPNAAPAAGTAAPPPAAPPAGPAAPAAGNTTADAAALLGGAAKGMSEAFFTQAFDALATGKDTIAGVRDPVLAAAKPFFDQGLITGPDDLRALYESGQLKGAPSASPSPTSQPAGPAQPAAAAPTAPPVPVQPAAPGTADTGQQAGGPAVGDPSVAAGAAPAGPVPAQPAGPVPAAASPAQSAPSQVRAPQPGDVMSIGGRPWASRAIAERRARALGADVVELDGGGFAVRPKVATDNAGTPTFVSTLNRERLNQRETVLDAGGAPMSPPKPSESEAAVRKLRADLAEHRRASRQRLREMLIDMGGVDRSQIADVLGSSKGNTSDQAVPGLFRNGKGLGVDELVAVLQENGYIPGNVDSLDGAELAYDLLRKLAMPNTGTYTMEEAVEGSMLEQAVAQAESEADLTQAEREAIVELQVDLGADAMERLRERAAIMVGDGTDPNEYMVVLNALIQEEIAKVQQSGPNEPDQGDQRAQQAADTAGGGEATGAGGAAGPGDAGGQAGGQEDGLLTNPTPEELRAREEARKKAEAEAKAAEDRANAPSADAFTLTGSDRPADQAAAAGQTDMFGNSPAEKPAGWYGDASNPLLFTSGMSRIPDFTATLGAGKNVGVEIGELSDKAVSELAKAMANSTGSLFIDTGAFSVFRANMRLEKMGKPQMAFEEFGAAGKGLDFDAIFKRFNGLADALAKATDDGGNEVASRVFYVMPDVVGNQAESLELAARYAEEIRDWGIRAIVPIQLGKLSPVEAFDELRNRLGMDSMLLGIPSNEKAFPLDQLEQLIRERGDAIEGLHFLGAAADRVLQPKLDLLKKLSYDGNVSADANRLRSLMYGDTKRSEALRKLLGGVVEDRPKSAIADEVRALREKNKAERTDEDRAVIKQLDEVVAEFERVAPDASFLAGLKGAQRNDWNGERGKLLVGRLEFAKQKLAEITAQVTGSAAPAKDTIDVLAFYKDDGDSTPVQLYKQLMAEQLVENPETAPLKRAVMAANEALQAAADHLNQRGYTVDAARRQPNGSELRRIADEIGGLGGAAWRAIKQTGSVVRGYERGDRNKAAKAVADLVQDVATLRRLIGEKSVDEVAHEAATSPLNDKPEPTDAQKEAGNYAKGHVRIAGLDMAIENPAGTRRNPEWPVLPAHYGYIKRTQAADSTPTKKQGIDVFINPGTPEDFDGEVYIVDQVDQKTGEFDEHKVMLGYPDGDAADQAYESAYTKGWKVGTVNVATMTEFKQWLAEGDTTKEFGEWQLRQSEKSLTQKAEAAITKANITELQTLTLPAARKGGHGPAVEIQTGNVGDGFVYGITLNTTSGTYAGLMSSIVGAAKYDARFETREDALAAALDRARKFGERVVNDKSSPANDVQRKEGRRIIDWVDEQLNKLGKAAESNKPKRGFMEPMLTTVEQGPAGEVRVEITQNVSPESYEEIYKTPGAIVGIRATGPGVVDGTWNRMGVIIAGKTDEAALRQHVAELMKDPTIVKQSKSTIANEITKLKGKKKGAAAPAPNLAPAPEANIDAEKMEKAKAKVAKGLDDLANLLGTKKNLTPEERRKLLPILSDILGGLMEMGYLSFKAAVRAALEQLRPALGDRADEITLRDFQGAYVALAQDYAGADDMASVMAVKDIKEVNDVSGPDENPEPPGGGKPGDAAGQNDLFGEGGGSGDGGARSGGDQARKSGRRSGRGPVVDNAGNAVPGTSSDPATDGEGSELSGVAAGSEQSDGSGVDGLAGPSPDAISAEALDRAAAEPATLEDKAKAQADALKTAIVVGDAANVDATLPALSPAQREDVLFAEKSWGARRGVMFTNGTGTGKTWLSEGAALRMQRQGKGNILIVVPSDKLENDHVSVAKVLGVKLHKIEGTRDAGKVGEAAVTTYTGLWQNAALMKRDWDLIIMDEAHKVMEGADADEDSVFTQAFRAHARDPRGGEGRARLEHPQEAAPYYGAIKDEEVARKKLKEAIDNDDGTPAKTALIKMAKAAHKMAVERVAKERAKFWPFVIAASDAMAAYPQDKRAKVMFLSATPFAYEKSVDYAEGYLFDYPQRQSTGAYNEPNGYQQFFIQHFGYSMKNNKLTRPGPEVDTSLMQRQFNSWLKKTGALSGRMLDVPYDYDRKFVAVASELGNAIDQAWEWLSSLDQHPGESKEDAQARRWLLRSYFELRFDHVARMRLLEALKVDASVPMIQQHLDRGRKVVVFHDYIEGGVPEHPFKLHKRTPADKLRNKSRTWKALEYALHDDPKDSEKIRAAFDRFAAQFPQLVNADLTGMQSPIEAITQAFGERATTYNGRVGDSQRQKRVMAFQGDDSGVDVIVVQSQANAGLSLHDTTGVHPRVMINLGLPGAPVTTIQQEGRIFRYGQASNGMFRYLNTGTRWERWAFADRIAGKAEVVENLSMGEQARALRDSYISAFQNTDEWPVGHEDEGTGGKELDRRADTALSEFDRAKTFYFAQQKKTQRTKAAEGADYFATPEPVGVKLVEWLGLKPGERGLEPNGGHGAIARWFGELVDRTAIEPSEELASRLRMVFDGKTILGRFEDHAISNKYDGIAMNPPYNSPGSTGGKLAMEHLDKAFHHLHVGGRVAAIIPRGPSMDKRLEAWLSQLRDMPLNPKATHPTLGELYAGDRVKFTYGTYAGEGTVVSASQSDPNVLWMRDIALNNIKRPGDLPIQLAEIKEVTSKGPRTQPELRSAGARFVASIDLPSSTFERAATSVRTRIVVFDRTDAKGADTSPEVTMDLSDSDTIGELFNAIEYVTLPPRPAPVAEKVSVAKPKAETPAPKTITSASMDLWEQKHTQTGETQYMMLHKQRTSRDEYDKAAAIVKKHGGWWNRWENSAEGVKKGFAFKTPEQRQAALDEMTPPGPAASIAAAPVDQTRATPEQVKAVAAYAREFMNKLAPAAQLEVSVVSSTIDVADDYLRSVMQSNAGTQGIYVPAYGKVIIDASKIDGADALRVLLTHEVIGHHGVEAVLGSQFLDVIKDVQRLARAKGTVTGNEQIGDADYATIESVKALYGPITDAQAAREVLARMAETGVRPTFMEMLYAKLRAAIRALGINLRYTNAELKQIVIDGATFMRTGVAPFGRRGDGAAYFGWQQPSAAMSPTSESFKQWFGDSKVVDENGEPLVVYHGTTSDFTQFDLQRGGAVTGAADAREGFFFASNPKAADQFTWKAGDKIGSIMPVYLSLQNPAYSDLVLTGGNGRAAAMQIKDAKAAGHDGIIFRDSDMLDHRGQVFVAFRPEQIKSAIGNNGNFDPRNPDIAASITPPGGEARIAEAALRARQGLRERSSSFIHRLQGLIDPLYSLPQRDAFMAERYQALGKIADSEQIAEGVRKVFADASDEAKEQAFRFLTDRDVPDTEIRDPVIRDASIELKRQINAIGDRLVAKGLLSEASRRMYKDQYLPRLYLRHLLNEDDFRALGAGKKPSDMGYLKQRKDLDEVTRSIILGEIKDPGYLGVAAIAKPLRDLALLDWLASISTNIAWSHPSSFVNWNGRRVTAHWLKAEAAQIRLQSEMYTDPNRIAALALANRMDQVADARLANVPGDALLDYRQIPNTPRYGHLRGMWVRHEIYDDLMGVHDFFPSDGTVIGSLFGYGGAGTKLTAWWKMGKVALNIPAQIRNVVSNMVLLQLSGVPLARVPVVIAQAIREIRDDGVHYRIAKKYGVEAATFTSNELVRVDADLLKLKEKVHGLSAFEKLQAYAAPLTNFAGDLYQKIESVFKTAKIIDELRQRGWRANMPVAEREAIEAAAALEAHRAMFDYSLVNKELRYARNAPIGSPFITFTAKVLPQLIDVARHHPQRFLPWAGLFLSMPYITAALTGADDGEDIDKLYDTMQQWQREKGHIVVLPYRDSEGRWQVVDLGYFMPWSFYTDMIPLSTRTVRRTFEGDLAAARTSLGKDYANTNVMARLMGLIGGPVPDMLIALKTGRDSFTGREILPAGGSTTDKAVAWTNYVWDLMMPPMISSRGFVSPVGLLDADYGGKLVQAVRGDTNRFGEPRATPTQAAVYMAGMNTNSLDPQMTRSANIIQLRREIEQARILMIQKLRGQQGDGEDARKRREEIQAEGMAEIERRVKKLVDYVQQSELPAYMLTNKAGPQPAAVE